MRSCLKRACALSILLLSLCVCPMAAFAAEPPLSIDGLSFGSYGDWLQSDYFKSSGGRCATPDRDTRLALYGESLEDAFGGGDCTAGSTNPSEIYEPGVNYEIQVVVHILMNTACTQGVISDELVHSQIDILNEDFLALAGTNGSNGYDGQISFVLATEDPQGQPTTGITRTCNTTYYNDGGSYWNELAWDPNRYMNVYTNQAGGNLGYVPFLPADGGGSNVGNANDRVVVLWTSFGRDSSIGPPYDQGRTSTHEVGHYLGMEHTFSGGCGTASEPGCFSTGDLICDTNTESGPVFSPCQVGASSSCGTTDPSDNYMDYSDDLCMMRFTQQQVRRMRCTLEDYRTGIYSTGGGSDIFDDGFESEDTAAWSSSEP